MVKKYLGPMTKKGFFYKRSSKYMKGKRPIFVAPINTENYINKGER